MPGRILDADDDAAAVVAGCLADAGGVGALSSSVRETKSVQNAVRGSAGRCVYVCVLAFCVYSIIRIKYAHSYTNTEHKTQPHAHKHMWVLLYTHRLITLLMVREEANTKK